MELGLPPTIFMDRNHPEKLPAIQLSFIQHLVSPLFHSCAEAGIIPGMLDAPNSRSPTPVPLGGGGGGGEKTEGEPTSLGVTVPDDNASDVSDLEDDVIGEDEMMSSAMAESSESLSSHKFVSVILNNLKINYEGWQAELPPEEGGEGEGEEGEGEGEEGEGEGSSVDRPTGVGGGGGHAPVSSTSTTGGGENEDSTKVVDTRREERGQDGESGLNHLHVANIPQIKLESEEV